MSFPPIPAPVPSPFDVRTQPFVIRDQQNWAEVSERRSQTEAMFRYGEYTMFVLMWNLQDLLDGLVGRCQRCYLAYGKVADAYGQAAQSNCPDCFGTTFEGGYRARVVRPAVWEDTNEDFKPGQRGEIVSNNTTVQTTPDIRIRTDDYVFRADGTRWEARNPSGQSVRTGFGFDAQDRQIANVPFRVDQLSSTDTGFIIPPLNDVLLPYLQRSARYPIDFSLIEDVRSYLL